jgi:hypothetical protein
LFESHAYFWRRFFGRFGVVKKSILTDMSASFDSLNIIITADSSGQQRRPASP